MQILMVQQQYSNNPAKRNRYNRENKWEVAWMENKQITHSLKGLGVLSLFFQMIFLAAAIYFRSAYLIGCGGLLLWLGGFRLLAQKPKAHRPVVFCFADPPGYRSMWLVRRAAVCRTYAFL